MLITRYDVLLHDLVASEESSLNYTREEAHSRLLFLSQHFQGQDFGFDVEGWRTWLLDHFPAYREWAEFQNSIIKP